MFLDKLEVLILFEQLVGNPIFGISVLVIAVAFTAVMMKKGKNIGLVMLVDSVFILIGTGMSLGASFNAFIKGLVSEKMISILIVMILVLMIENIMRKSGMIKQIVDSLQMLIKNRKFAAILMPFVLGLLPSPGGARFSCPMVEEAAGNELENVDKAFLNYWYRHTWMDSFILYPGIILAAELTEIPVISLFAGMTGFMVLHALSGLPFLFRARKPAYADNVEGDTSIVGTISNIASDAGVITGTISGADAVVNTTDVDVDLNVVTVANTTDTDSDSDTADADIDVVPVANISDGVDTKTGTARSVAFRSLLSGIFPILLIISLYMVFLPYTKYSLQIATFTSVILLIIIKKYGSKAVWNLIKESAGIKYILIIAGVMIFNEFLQDSGLVDSWIDRLSHLNIPVQAFFILLPFIGGAASGISITYISLTFPILLPMGLLGSRTFAVIALASGFAGSMVTPVHLCGIMSADFFKVKLGKMLKKVIISETFMMVFIVLAAFFLLG